jgi:hypothetical protein
MGQVVRKQGASGAGGIHRQDQRAHRARIGVVGTGMAHHVDDEAVDLDRQYEDWVYLVAFFGGGLGSAVAWLGQRLAREQRARIDAVLDRLLAILIEARHPSRPFPHRRPVPPAIRHRGAGGIHRQDQRAHRARIGRLAREQRARIDAVLDRLLAILIEARATQDPAALDAPSRRQSATAARAASTARISALIVRASVSLARAWRRRWPGSASASPASSAPASTPSSTGCSPS